jgi:hypothetical protein
MREQRYGSTINDLDFRWKLVVNFTLQPLYPLEIVYVLPVTIG